MCEHPLTLESDWTGLDSTRLCWCVRTLTVKWPLVKFVVVACWQNYKSLFIITPPSCTNFGNLFLSWNSTCFGRFLCPSSAVYSLCTQQWYMLYRFVDSFRAGPGWNCKFTKLVHLVGLIIKKFVTMQHGHMNLKYKSLICDNTTVSQLKIGDFSGEKFKDF
jgi:hypothetical protein